MTNEEPLNRKKNPALGQYLRFQLYNGGKMATTGNIDDMQIRERKPWKMDIFDSFWVTALRWKAWRLSFLQKDISKIKPNLVNNPAYTRRQPNKCRSGSPITSSKQPKDFEGYAVLIQNEVTPGKEKMKTLTNQKQAMKMYKMSKCIGSTVQHWELVCSTRDRLQRKARSDPWARPHRTLGPNHPSARPRWRTSGWGKG